MWWPQVIAFYLRLSYTSVLNLGCIYLWPYAYPHAIPWPASPKVSTIVTETTITITGQLIRCVFPLKHFLTDGCLVLCSYFAFYYHCNHCHYTGKPAPAGWHIHTSLQEGLHCFPALSWGDTRRLVNILGLLDRALESTQLHNQHLFLFVIQNGRTRALQNDLQQAVHIFDQTVRQGQC